MNKRLAFVAAILISIILGIAFPVTAVLMFNIVAPFMDQFLKWITVNSTNKFGGLSTLWIPLILGLIAFGIRKYLIWLYATIEVFFGVYGAGIALSLLYRPDLLPVQFQSIIVPDSAYPQYVGLGSAIYVMVRGLDNWTSWVVQKS